MNNLLKEEMQLEGKRFLLYKKMDTCKSIYEYQKSKAEIDIINQRLKQIKELRQK